MCQKTYYVGDRVKEIRYDKAVAKEKKESRQEKTEEDMKKTRKLKRKEVSETPMNE